MKFHLWADMVVLLHASFVLFVLLGGWICPLAAASEQVMRQQGLTIRLVDVKAVTLHHFQVAFKDNLWKAFVVLDV